MNVIEESWAQEEQAWCYAVRPQTFTVAAPARKQTFFNGG
jgi:hypothetical protein